MWPPTQGPSPVIFRCHWHLGERLRKIVRENKIDQNDPLRVRLRHNGATDLCTCIFCGDGARWDDWEADARNRKLTPLTKWIDRNGSLIRWQLENRTKLRAKTSVGPLEQAFTAVTDAFNNRRGLIRNRERLNRRMMLIQLEANGQAKLGAYAKVIRDELLKNAGYGAQRYVVDDKNGSSLRLY
jgi:hypothetical protein